jgi:hypothetical protein
MSPRSASKPVPPALHLLLGVLLLALPVARAQDIDVRLAASFLPTDANVRLVASDGNRAFVYNQGFTGNRLLVLDLADPASPRELGTLTLAARVEQVCPAGDRLYLAAGPWGLIVVDVSDPTQPRELGRHLPDENITSVVADGTRLYVGNAYFGSANSGVLVFDSSAPGTLARLGRVSGIYPRALSRRGRTIVGSQPGTFFVADVSDPAQPLAPQSQPLDGDGLGIAVHGDTAYVASGTGGLFAFDLTTSPPRRLFRYAGPSGWTYRHVAVAGPRAYLAGDFAGLEVVHLDGAAGPARIGTFPAFTEAPALARALALDGPRILLAAGAEGLLTLDDSAPAQLRRVGHYPMVVSGETRVSQGRAYVSGPTSVEILDVRQPPQPVPLGTIAIHGSRALLLEDTNLFVHADFSGLHVLRVDDPANPWRFGGVQLCPDCRAGTLARIGTNLVAVAPWGHQFDPVGTLNILDPRSRHFPQPIGDWDEASGYSPGLAVHDPIAYLAGLRRRTEAASSTVAALSIIDLSDPAHPADLGFREPTGMDAPHFAHLAAGHLYLGDTFGRIAIFDVSVPADPREVGNFSVRGRSLAMDSRDGYAYVATADGGLVVLDLADPVHPTPVTRNSSVYAESVTVAEGIVYVGGGSSGLHLLGTYTPPVTLAARVVQNHQLVLRVTAPGGGSVRLEKSATLGAAWTEWRTVVAEGGSVEATDTLADAAGGMFYRASPIAPAPDPAR